MQFLDAFFWLLTLAQFLFFALSLCGILRILEEMLSKINHFSLVEKVFSHFLSKDFDLNNKQDQYDKQKTKSRSS